MSSSRRFWPPKLTCRSSEKRGNPRTALRLPFDPPKPIAKWLSQWDDVSLRRPQQSSSAKEVKRFDAYRFYQLGAHLHRLEDLQGEPTLREVEEIIVAAMNLLRLLLEDLTGLSIPLAKAAAKELQSELALVLPTRDFADDWEGVDWDTRLSGLFVIHVKQLLGKLESVLEAELRSSPTYCVGRQGIYDTSDLLERAETALGDSAKVLPERARKDFNQAGRCLALDLPTASAFHATRATEAVLRQYHGLVMKRSKDATATGMAVCIRELRVAGEDPKLMDILDHIRDLHRNTTMHPETFLETKEALRLFDVVKSAINAMADRIRVLRRPARSVPAFDPDLGTPEGSDFVQ